MANKRDLQNTIKNLRSTKTRLINQAFEEKQRELINEVQPLLEEELKFAESEYQRVFQETFPEVERKYKNNFIDLSIRVNEKLTKHIYSNIIIGQSGVYNIPIEEIFSEESLETIEEIQNMDDLRIQKLKEFTDMCDEAELRICLHNLDDSFKEVIEALANFSIES